MAVLNRYRVRVQFFRDIIIDAKNQQDAKSLAELDGALDGDSDIVKALQATLVEENVAEGGGAQLNRYNVRTQIRRNVVIDAIDRENAKDTAVIDVITAEDTDDIQPLQTLLLEENTGTTG